MPTCYRHTDRETGVACSSCERPICPDCMTTTPVGMRCPECARDRTQVRSLRSLEREPTLTYALIGLNVLVALAVLLGGGLLFGYGAVSRSTVAQGEVWRVLTAGFLHGGMLHLAFNMFALYILGGLLEPAIGRFRFALLYLVSLLAGSFGALIGEPNDPTVGASGGIFGLMGAAIVIMRSRGINPLESGLVFFLGLNLLITFLPGTNISAGGHIGGLVGGTLAALLLFEIGDRVRVPAVVPAAAVAALGGLAVAGSLAISGG